MPAVVEAAGALAYEGVVTMTQMWGADADELDDLARRFRNAVDTLDDITITLRTQIRMSAWGGVDGERMRHRFETYDMPGLRRATEHLRDASVRLSTQARDQREASGARQGWYAGPGLRFPGSGPQQFPFNWFDLAGGLVLVLQLTELVRGLPRAWDHAVAIRDWLRLNRHLGGAAAQLDDWWKLAPAAGPLGGVAWFVSYEGTKGLLHVTGADRAIGDGAYSLAYGSGDDLTPSEAAAISKRTENPINVLSDLREGAWNKVGGWFR